MATPIWYLGPEGDLRALPAPERDIKAGIERFGGIHQGLSGARTLDVTGYRASYEFQFKYLEQAEWAFLRRMHLRSVPGPFRLIDPFYPNRLTPESADCRVGAGTARGMTITGGNTIRDWDMPGVGAGEVNLGGQSTKWYNRSGLSIVRWDLKNRTTIRYDSEIILASVSIRSSATVSGHMGIDWFDRTGAQISGSMDATINTVTSWGRYWVSARPPANATACVMFYYTSDTSAEIYFAKAQVEGVAATELLPNPTFDSGVTGWTGSGGAVSSHTNAYKTPGMALRFDPVGGLSAPAIVCSAVPVTAGVGYSLTGMMYSTLGWAGVQAVIQWKNSGGGVISSTIGSLSAAPTGVWKEYSVRADAPALATQADIRFTMAGTPGSSDRIYLDQASFKSDAATPSVWGVGGGAPVVLLDQLPTTSPRWPMTDATMNLLEA